MDDGVSVELVHCGDDALLEFLFRCDADVVSIGVQKSDPLRRGIGVQNIDPPRPVWPDWVRHHPKS